MKYFGREVFIPLKHTDLQIHIELLSHQTVDTNYNIVWKMMNMVKRKTTLKSCLYFLRWKLDDFYTDVNTSENLLIYIWYFITWAQNLALWKLISLTKPYTSSLTEAILFTLVTKSQEHKRLHLSALDIM